MDIGNTKSTPSACSRNPLVLTSGNWYYESTMTYRPGFTIVEIIVVITVIGILSGIGVVSYSGMQVRARDTERAADAESMRTAFETYYEQKGDYPALTPTELGLITDFYTNTLRIPASALVAPAAPAGATFSWGWGTTAGSTSQYVLATFHADGTQCMDTTPCTRYVITWWKEADNSQQQILSKFGN